MFHVLAWLVILFVIALGSAREHITINCRKRCHKIKQVDKNQLWRDCEFREINGLPRPSVNETTAPLPYHFNSTWFINTKKKTGRKYLGIKVSWSQAGLCFSPGDPSVKGYVVVIQPNSGEERNFQVSFNFSKHPLRFFKSKFFFNFFFCESDLVRPGWSYSITILSIPLFQPTTNVQKRNHSLSIPKCTEHKDVRTTKACKEKLEKEEIANEREKKRRKKRKMKKARKMEERKRKNNAVSGRQPETSLLLPIVVVLAVAFVVLIIGFIVFVYVWMYKRQNHKQYQECQQKEDHTRFLILVNSIEEDPLYHQAANLLATMLGEKHVFNLWQLSSIKEDEDWTAEQMKHCHHVVFICTPTGKQRCDKFTSCKYGVVDAFMAGMYWYIKGDVRKVGATAVYFDENASLCVPESLSHHVQQFQMTEKFHKFIKHIKNKELLPQGYKELNQLQDIVKKIRSIQSKESSVSVEHAVNNSNDSTFKDPSLPTICSFSDEVESLVDKNEVVCNSLEKDSGIF